MIGGALDQVDELRRLFGHRSWDIGNAADAVGVALRRFTSSSSEYVPALPAHEHRAHDLADRCRDLGRRTEAARDALAAADRWVGTTRAMQLRDLAWDAQDVVGATGLWQAKGMGAHALRSVLDRHEPAHWKHAAFKRDVLGLEGRPIPGGKARADGLRTARNERNARWRAALDRHSAAHDRWAGAQRPDIDALRSDVERLRGRLDRVVQPELAARAADEAASAWTRTQHLLTNSRVGAVARLGSEAVGVAGMAYDGLELYRGVHEGDTEQVVTSAVSLGAGLAMLFPPTAVAGAVVTGGLLVYEYRDEIASAAGEVRDAARDMLGAAASAIGGLF